MWRAMCREKKKKSMMKKLYGKGLQEEKWTLTPGNRKSTMCLESRMSTGMNSNKWLKRQYGSDLLEFMNSGIKYGTNYHRDGSHGFI